MRKFLAPYEASLKQLAGKADALKGYPLKSAVRIAFGGPTARIWYGLLSVG